MSAAGEVQSGLQGACAVVVAGEALSLLPQRAVWWPSRRLVLVADLHLGKDDTMRVHGLAVPAGCCTQQLRRLSTIINSTGAQRVLVLGDLLHAPAGITDALVEEVAAWRTTTTVNISVVPGNHDRKLERVAQAWGLEVLANRVVDGPFAFVHDPCRCEEDGVFTWCGHIHPSITLRSSADSIKLPCFHIGRRVGVLPAFSTFTAGVGVRREVGDRLFAAAPHAVFEV